MITVRHLIVAFAAVTFLGVGCSQTKEVGKSTKQLFRGEQGGVVGQSPQQVAQAVDAAIADLKLMKIGATTRPSKEQVETVVIARNPADAKVTIAFRATSQDADKTRIAVSTGALGNSSLRDQVWDAVRIRLGVLNLAATRQSPAAAPAAPAPAPAATADANDTSATATTQPSASSGQFGPPTPPAPVEPAPAAAAPGQPVTALQ